MNRSFHSEIVRYSFVAMISVAFMSFLSQNLYAGAADELKKAKYEEKTNSEGAAFDAAMDGLIKFPQDKNLFLYAIEMSASATQSQLSSLESKAETMAEKNPNDYSWNLSLCSIKRRLGKTDAALQACLKAVQYGRNEFKANLETARTYLNMGVYDRAEEFAKTALEISPADFEALYTMGSVYEAQNIYVKAKKNYAAALATAGDDISSRAEANAAMASQALKRINNSQKKQRQKSMEKKTRENLGASAEACTKQFNDEADKNDLDKAADTGKACMRKNPRNFKLSSRLADVLVDVGEYEEAIDEYERALKLAGDDNKAYARLCIKEAETLIRLEDRTAAEKKYRMAAAAAPFDSKILVTVADYFLKQTSYKEALHYFTLALQIDPQNKYAKKKAESLALDMMSDEEILDELKKKGAVPEKTKTLTEKELRLHRNIRAAEAAGAVEILRKKFPGRPQFYYEDRTNGLKILLSYEGYLAYSKSVTRDAIRFFEQKKINFREIFKLRDLNGEPLFDKSGQITPEGIAVWSEAAATGRVTWILSYQPVPGSRKQITASRELIKLSKKGYREISEPEYLWLLRATNCPQDVLSDKSPIYLQKVNDGATTHYMLCYVEGSSCLNTVNRLLPIYIERYRNGDTEIPTGKATSFFGSGGTRQYRFCENGKIWDGGI